MTRPPHLPVSRERDVQAAGLQAARAMGHLAYVNHVHRGGTTRQSGLGTGSPDTVILLQPLQVALFVEWKRSEKESPSPRQAEWHRRHRAGGGYVVTCWNVPQLIAAIRAVERETADRARRLTTPAAERPGDLQRERA